MHALGLPVPGVGEVMHVNGRNGLVYQRVAGDAMWETGRVGDGESGDTVAVEWVKSEDVVGRITHAAIRDRVQDLLASDGRVVYRSYSSDPYRIHDQYFLEDARI